MRKRVMLLMIMVSCGQFVFSSGRIYVSCEKEPWTALINKTKQPYISSKNATEVIIIGSSVAGI